MALPEMSGKVAGGFGSVSNRIRRDLVGILIFRRPGCLVGLWWVFGGSLVGLWWVFGRSSTG